MWTVVLMKDGVARYLTRGKDGKWSFVQDVAQAFVTCDTEFLEEFIEEWESFYAPQRMYLWETH